MSDGIKERPPMAFTSGRLSREQSDAVATRIRKHFDRHGYGLWAVELPELAPFIGFVGLSIPSFEAHFTPCVEIGWRLACEHWGRGYASEAATAALDFGFGELGLAEIVSFTSTVNQRSMRVMERIGMTRAPEDDFDHPSLAEGHPLRRHVLYRISRAGVRLRWSGIALLSQPAQQVFLLGRGQSDSGTRASCAGRREQPDDRLRDERGWPYPPGTGRAPHPGPSVRGSSRSSRRRGAGRKPYSRPASLATPEPGAPAIPSP